jgi:Ca2+/H+ antiporter
METLCDLYAFLMLKSLIFDSFAFPALIRGRRTRTKMLAITFIVSCLSVCAFYVYVLVHLERERKRMKAHEKHLPEHFYEMEPKPREKDADNPKGPSISEEILRQTMIHLGLTLGGLMALFGGIEFFNSLVTWLHWY